MGMPESCSCSPERMLTLQGEEMEEMELQVKFCANRRGIALETFKLERMKESGSAPALEPASFGRTTCEHARDSSGHGMRCHPSVSP